MEKRLILAIVLSVLVLWLWSALAPQQHPIENKEVTAQAPATISMATQPIPLSPATKPTPSSLIRFNQEKMEVTFDEAQAVIKEVVFKAHQDYKFSLQSGLAIADNALAFRKENISPKAVSFVHSDPNKKIIKEFILDNSNYSMELVVKVQNMSNLPLQTDWTLILGVLQLNPKNVQSRYQDITIATIDKVTHLAPQRDMTFPGINFLGLRDRYFCILVEPEAKDYQGFIRKIAPNEFNAGIQQSAEITLLPGQSTTQKFRIYLGPQDLRIINQVKPAWSALIHYGTFNFISQILLQLLEFFYRLVHNWGWAIVILSLAVYLLLYPLTVKQMRSMKEMQILQPQIEKLRQLYKDSPQKLNKEIMALYHQHKVNPLGGCLPLLLQLPIFFALYQALMRFVALKGANFLWIKDLSEPDRLFLLPQSLPGIGNEINVLPIVMAIGMFIQQKMSLTAASGSAAEQQKIMLFLFPLLFGFIFYRMPSGLVLYWFINSALMLVNQLRIGRVK